MINLKNRHFVKLLDFTKNEIQYLLDLSRDLKRAKYIGTEVQRMKGKNVCLLFQKDSTRTRCAFEVGAMDQGAHTVYLGPSGSQFGKKESVSDSAKVLGRMFDGIQFRGFSQDAVEELAANAGVPVWNGLTDKFHPTQILADFLTIIEVKKKLKGIRFAYYGDAQNNMGNSLMIGAAKMGMHFVCVAPKELWPEQKLINECQSIIDIEETGGSLTFETDPIKGAKNVDVFYTDVWVSMGEPEEVWETRIKQLKDYQINMKIIKAAKEDVMFLHCLPAFHDTNTIIGKKIQKKFGIDSMEVSDEVFNSKHSFVFQQAENRLHTIKAIMVATIGS